MNTAVVPHRTWGPKRECLSSDRLRLLTLALWPIEDGKGVVPGARPVCITHDERVGSFLCVADVCVALWNRIGSFVFLFQSLDAGASNLSLGLRLSTLEGIPSSGTCHLFFMVAPPPSHYHRYCCLHGVSSIPNIISIGGIMTVAETGALLVRNRMFQMRMCERAKAERRSPWECSVSFVFEAGGHTMDLAEIVTSIMPYDPTGASLRVPVLRVELIWDPLQRTHLSHDGTVAVLPLSAQLCRT